MRDKGKGYVFIFTNKSFRDNWLKIGTSTLPVDELIEELDTEDMATPYDPLFIIQTEDFELLEERSHRLLDQFAKKQWMKNHGFYELDPTLALGLLLNTALEVLIHDVVLIYYLDGEPRQVYPLVDAPQARMKDAPSKD